MEKSSLSDETELIMCKNIRNGKKERIFPLSDYTVFVQVSNDLLDSTSMIRVASVWKRFGYMHNKVISR